MAANYIKIDRTKTHANKIISAVAKVRDAAAALDEIQGIGFHNFSDSDFSAFEALFGIPAGSGQVVFDLINGSANAIAGTSQNANATELINRVG